jgi:ABC-type dipeptide/oligopeptide/nickel transport system permease component
MGAYVLNRVLQLVPVLWLISVIVFAVMHILPGDPAALMLAGAEGGAVTPQRLVELREEMGLNDPLLVQYGRFLGNALMGDLGTSVRFRTEVTGLVLERFPSTLELAVSGLFVALLIGVPLGMIAAVRQNTWIDATAMSISYVGASMPIYFLGLVLILLFAFNLRWLPAAGSEGWDSLILPAVTLGFVSAGLISRLVRSSLIEVLGEDYIRTARAYGISKWRLLFVYALKNALIPFVTVLGLELAALLFGSVVIESVFAWPGVGSHVLGAILNLDFPVIMGFTVLASVVYVAANLLVDLSYLALDPRIKAVG